MWAVMVDEPGGPEAMHVREVAAPAAGPGEVVIEVAAAGVNRADLLQRQGFYPPPPGASEILGLECSGTVVSAGPGVSGWSRGDRVCALLDGGGYGQFVAVPAGQVMPVPDGLSLVEAAALPEVACTVYSNLAMVAGLRGGQWLLVHGGGSGIGTFAIQWAVARGARVAVTAGSPEKLRRCSELGADILINYRQEDFAARMLADADGADVILDVIGAKYLADNIRALAPDGRLVVIGLQGGVKAELNLNALLAKRASVTATSLRGRPAAQKADICAQVVEKVWPLVESGAIRPVIDRTLDAAQAGEAHRLMADSAHFGKLLLVAPEASS